MATRIELVTKVHLDDYLADFELKNPGPKGATGATGATGPIGPIGVTGAIGAKGATGTTGLTGPIGLTGPQGAKGDTGVIGPTGTTGAIGPKGDIGLTGAIGPIGVTGAVGAKGATGTTGAIGPKGDTGATGAGLTILGSLASVGNLPATGNKTGDAYMVGTNMHVWNGTVWQNMGSIQGPKGDTGDVGAKGATGTTGATGAIGPKGDKGDVGATGASAPNVPDATLALKGIVQLNDTVTSTLKTQAATAFAVKTAYDVAQSHLIDTTSHVRYGADTGTANAKLVTISPVPASYIEGMGISFKNKVENTGPSTINVNARGVKSILKSDGSELASGNLKVGSIYTIRYNGVSFLLQGESGGLDIGAVELASFNANINSILDN